MDDTLILTFISLEIPDFSSISSIERYYQETTMNITNKPTNEIYLQNMLRNLKIRYNMKCFHLDVDISLQ